MFTMTNNTFYVLPSSVNTVPNLPKGIYNLNVDGDGRLFLSKSEDDFTLPSKLYGNVDNRSSRIINTYKERLGENTGVGLFGTKGSGKSMMAKKLGQETINTSNEHGDGVVIIIGFKVEGAMLATILEAIKQPCMVLLDEFEKIFDSEHQEKMLSIMDGSLTVNKLFVVTVNNIWKVNEHMINRPGRIYYNLTYRGLEREFVEEYLKDKLKDTKYFTNIVRTSQIIEDFNFDMLKAIVEELNRYPDSTYEECIDMLNIIPSLTSIPKTKFIYKITSINGENVSEKYTNSQGDSALTSKSSWLSFSKIKTKTKDKDQSEDEDEDDDFDDENAPSDKLKSYYSFDISDLDVISVNDDGTVVTLKHPVLNIDITAFKTVRKASSGKKLIS